MWPTSFQPLWASYWLFRGRYSHSSQVFEAAARRTFASIRSVCSVLCRCYRKKEGKWGNERDFFSRNSGAAVTGGDIVAAAIEFSCPFDSDG